MKRLFDFILASIMMLLLLPIFIGTILLIFFTMGRPIFFKQLRPGYKERIFTIYKFRTMSNTKDKNGDFLPDSERLSGIGKWIRNLSLDELPQLWNVLKGDMSFVGPRPLLVEYLSLYSPEQSRRHDVKPGITGWAQVNGRNAITWEEKFKLDIWYVDHMSIYLDIKILWLTLLKVLQRTNINALNSSTMEKFTGNKKSIYIYGASGHGLVVADIAEANGYNDIRFIDDGDNEFPTFEDILNQQNIPIALGIGDNNTRKNLFDKVTQLGFSILTLVHPSAVVSRSAILGRGSVVMPHAVINASSVIGKGVILNSSCIVEHECIVNDFVHISPNAALAGNVHIGEYTHIGINAAVIQGLHIGKNSVIGAGSTVINHLPDHITAVGTPAKIIKGIL